jgi:arylsulfatase A-like enzyme
MIMRLPKSWDKRCHGTEVKSVATLADIFPTLIAAAGGKTAKNIDGCDLAALARGKIKNPKKYVEGVFKLPWEPCAFLAITDGQWKYIWYLQGGVEQLFDLKNDPGERKNLANSKKHSKQKNLLKNELVKSLKKRGPSYLKKGKLPKYKAEKIPDADLRNQSWAGYHTEFSDVDVRH